MDPGAPRPQIFTTQAGDSRGDAPVLELSLEDDRLRLGGTLAGADDQLGKPLDLAALEPQT